MFSDIRSVRWPLIGSKVVVTSGGVRQPVTPNRTRIAPRRIACAFMLPKSLSLPICLHCSIGSLTYHKSFGEDRVFGSIQPLDADISELDWIIVAGKSERPRCAILAGMAAIGPEVANL